MISDFQKKTFYENMHAARTRLFFELGEGPFPEAFHRLSSFECVTYEAMLDSVMETINELGYSLEYKEPA
jgi:hypothetical protein